MKSGSILLALLVALLPACNAFRRQSTADQANPTILEVDNRGFVDMTVYALRDSERIRLGTATGNQKTTISIPAYLLNGMAATLRFIADPIGGTRASVSEEITVVPGDTVGLMIPPT